MYELADEQTWSGLYAAFQTVPSPDLVPVRPSCAMDGKDLLSHCLVAKDSGSGVCPDSFSFTVVRGW